MISEFLADQGRATNRASIFHAISKIDIYYKDYVLFRNQYDNYFNDKTYEEPKTIDKTYSKPKSLDSPVSYEKKILNDLHSVIESIPSNKKKEILDLITLRIKSWAWKSKDACEIIEGSSGVAGHW